MTHQAITKMMHTRAGMIAVSVAVVLFSLIAYSVYGNSFSYDTQGFVEKWSRHWEIPGLPDLIFQLVLNFMVVSLIVHLNKIYNLLRSMTTLQGSYFLLAELATPSLMINLCPGTVLCVIVIVCISMIFMVYDNEYFDTRNVFFVFVLLSGCMSFAYTFAVFIPVFIIACFQMRIFNIRTLGAIVLGLITPWIILLGFGLVSISDLTWPEVSFGIPRISTAEAALLVATVVYTIFITVAAVLQNMIKILTYNSRSRATLNVLTTLTAFTVIATIADYNNVYSYLSLLNCCAAIQLAHLFGAIHTYGKSYIGAFAIGGIYLLLYIARMCLPLLSAA